MTETGYVELLRAVYAAVNRGDYENGARALDPDIEWRAPMQGVLRGVDEVLAFWRSLPDQFSEFRLEPEEFVSAGDHVLVIVHSRAKGRNSGAELEGRTGHLWTFEHAKVVRYHAYATREEGLAALEAAPRRLASTPDT